jgi:hypothetical protein
MTEFTKTQEHFIEHEVKLRLHSEHFNRVDNDIRGIKRLLFSILGIGVTSLILPILLHSYKLT